MAVVLPDRLLGVRRRAAGDVDAHGARHGGEWAAMAGPWPGWLRVGDDVPVGEISSRTALMSLDPAGWPVAQGDLVVDPGAGQEWLVATARLIRNSAIPDVDYVRVEAHLHSVDGTRP